MKMKYLLLLIPIIANANFVSGPQSPAYAEQDVCEKTEQAPCFFLPPEKRDFRDLGAVVDVQKDDPSKPIIETAEPKEFCPETKEGEEKQECYLVCDEGFESVIEDDRLVSCKQIIGYEKMTVKEFVIAEEAKQARIVQREQAKQAERGRQAACEASKNAVKNISNATAGNQLATVNALLNLQKNCL